jgi:hypothetical protein
LIKKATEEVKLFLETCLILTSFFYRKSINLAFDRFATLVVEVITEILFSANDRKLFKFFLELYKI